MLDTSVIDPECTGAKLAKTPITHELLLHQVILLYTLMDLAPVTYQSSLVRPQGVLGATGDEKKSQQGQQYT